jgi:predicted TIM-barrel fold metal-dependent hydrolase
MNRRDFLSQSGVAGAAGVTVLAGESGPAAAADAAREELPLEASLPIIDAHHHLWDFPALPGYPVGRYLLPEFLHDIDRSGHDVTRTVFAECHAMYRADGSEAFKPIGETEFVNGIAAMAASGRYGSCRVASGIVGTADLRMGDRVREVLEAQVLAGNGRFRGIRIPTEWADLPVFGQPPNPAAKGVLLDPGVRRGAAILGELGLTWDMWVFHTQLDEVADAANAVSGTTIVLDHLGTPLGIGPFAGRREEVFATWRAGIEALSRLPNVVVKLGGLGMDLNATIGTRHRGASSEELFPLWRPYVETCIAAFGPERCMFESNFPPDAATCSYGALWNTFKRITAAYSPTEKAALYGGTATRVYRLLRRD